MRLRALIRPPRLRNAAIESRKDRRRIIPRRRLFRNTQLPPVGSPLRRHCAPRSPEGVILPRFLVIGCTRGRCGAVLRLLHPGRLNNPRRGKCGPLRPHTGLFSAAGAISPGRASGRARSTSCRKIAPRLRTPPPQGARPLHAATLQPGKFPHHRSLFRCLPSHVSFSLLSIITPAFP